MEISFDGNREFSLAWKLVEYTSSNVFLTGNAGTGKTTFLNYLRENSSKRIAVTAPTGIAAINASGVTIHSFFQLAPTLFLPGVERNDNTRRFSLFNKEKKRLIRAIDVLVIDEVSMVRPDLLDAIDDVLRRVRVSGKPFGGVQLLMIGDLSQLSPVITDAERSIISQYYDSPYFYSSHALRKAGYEMVEFKKIYRQNDSRFINLLNRVRNSDVDDEVLKALNSRYVPGFDSENKNGYIRLTTHNERANQINRQRLAALSGQEFCYQATVKGDFPENAFPVDNSLKLKVGAQVMFTRNNSSEGYYNGMIGVVVNCADSYVEVMPSEKKELIRVSKAVWQNTKYVPDEENGKIVEDVIGEFSQIPLRPAWAITIHKSQGLTFDHAIIDVANAFAHGQTYVALSRCRSLDGVILNSPISRSAFILDSGVAKFTNDRRTSMIDEKGVRLLTDRYFVTLLSDMFDFGMLRTSFNTLHRQAAEYIFGSYPRLAAAYSQADTMMRDEIENVSVRFVATAKNIIAQSPDYHNDAHLYERISSAARYFSEKIDVFAQAIKNTPSDANNKIATNKLKASIETCMETLFVVQRVLKYFCSVQFSVEALLDIRAKAKMELYSESSKNKKSSGQKKIVVPPDAGSPELYRALVDWRYKLSASRKVPAFTIMPNSSLVAISNIKPLSHVELLSIPGIGVRKVEQYGKDVIEIVKKNS